MKERYRDALGDAEYEKVYSRSVAHADAFLGLCMARVLGEPLGGFKGDILEWEPLEGYNSTEGLQLFNPQVSSDGASIIDVSENGMSCWTQFETPVSPLSIRPILDVTESFPPETLTMIDQQQGQGSNAITFNYQPNNGMQAVTIHLRVTWAPNRDNLVAIVRRMQ